MTVKKYTAKVGNDDAVGQGLAPAVILYEATLEVYKKLEITHKRLFCPLAVPDFIKFKIYATVGTALAAVRKSAKVGSDSELLGGRLQPNRRAERDFCGKGGVAK